MNKRVLNASIAVVLLSTFAVAAFARPQENQSRSAVNVLPVQGNIYMLVTGEANVTASVGYDGTLLVDSGSSATADQIVATIKDVASRVMATGPRSTCVGMHCSEAPGSGAYNQWGWSSPAFSDVVVPPTLLPLRWIINTSVDPDHTGGNSTVMSSGRSFTGGNQARVGGGSQTIPTTAGDKFRALGGGASIMAFETVFNRMMESKVSDSALPTETYYRPTHKWDGFFNGEGIELFHIPAAHSDGDTIVWFRYSDVISAGDVFAIDRYPRIDTEKGGTIQGVIDGLNKILDIAMPQFRAQGGTYIIPGHGRLCDSGDVAIYRNMVVKIRDRVQDMIVSGMTLEQVKAAKPTLDYDGRYGSPEAFVEAAYQSLNAKTVDQN